MNHSAIVYRSLSDLSLPHPDPLGLQFGWTTILVFNKVTSDSIIFGCVSNEWRTSRIPKGGSKVSQSIKMVRNQGLMLRPLGGVVWWIAVFVFLTSFVMFTIGPFIPLGFTDGSTLLEWWGKR